MSEAVEVPENINPGIRKIVALLNRHGFKTTDSGDGETHTYSCDRDYGYVTVRTRPERLAEDARKISYLLRARGINTQPFNPETSTPSIQASYDPNDNIGIIDIMNVHDRMLKDRPPRSWSRTELRDLLQRPLPASGFDPQLDEAARSMLPILLDALEYAEGVLATLTAEAAGLNAEEAVKELQKRVPPASAYNPFSRDNDLGHISKKDAEYLRGEPVLPAPTIPVVIEDEDE